MLSEPAFAPLTAVDDGRGHEDTGAASEGAHHVGDDREETEDGASKGRGGGDDPLELLVDRGVAVARKRHALVLELLGDVAGARARDLDPRLGEDGAGGDDEGDVDDGVEGVLEGGCERVGGRDVVGDARDGGELGRDVLEGLRGLG
jgi:hypothetical protein